jgi:hypothetical protein
VTPALLSLDPEGYTAHPLHTGTPIWSETNCYADLWIEVLHAFGFDPTAGLAFTLSTDFEDDQWTMFKYPHADLRALYGIGVNELNVWRPLVEHVAQQVEFGHLLTIDVDAWFLPDTQGITYRIGHQKTTLAANMLDLERSTLGYFHNAGYYELSGDDFDGVFGLAAYARDDALPPYVEAVRFDGPRPDDDGELVEVVRRITAEHLARVPDTNPIVRLRDSAVEDLPWLVQHDLDDFHRYAFGTFRQCGANAELAAHFVRWLQAHDGRDLEVAVDGFENVANGAKALEFVFARLARGRSASIDHPFDAMAAAWDRAIGVLAKHYAR